MTQNRLVNLFFYDTAETLLHTTVSVTTDKLAEEANAAFGKPVACIPTNEYSGLVYDDGVPVGVYVIYPAA